MLIIGGGPAGLTAGMYCRMRRLSVLVVDAGRVGGQLRSVYAEKPVHDWPGRPGVVAIDLADELAGHARRLEVALAEHEKAVDVRRLADGFEVVTRDTDTGEERVRPAKAGDRRHRRGRRRAAPAGRAGRGRAGRGLDHLPAALGRARDGAARGGRRRRRRRARERAARARAPGRG